ncbi:protein NYNRIN-like [Camellia sinensis]|uniref:protein NYNRIN-like n=1 Tax=Camellia sinensis TaxID=4442 RepID=UPI0010367C66|nr:protein NYNRIN-like [Camellia sinensis]
MEEDAKNFVRRCQSCQKFGNLIHAPALELHNMKTPYPFYTWAFDLVGPIAQLSKGHRWILAATEVSTKWVEAIPMRKANKTGVANFIKENLICRFGTPKVILSDNKM